MPKITPTNRIQVWTAEVPSDRSKNRHVAGLLTVADRLCEGLGTGPVRQAAFRRAISTAYYAVFHALCTACADGLVGWSRQDLVADVYRALDHGVARRKLLTPAATGLSSDFARFGLSFQDLQSRRHAADYAPPSFVVTRLDAEAAVAQARDAVAIIAGLSAEQRTKLAILLVVAQRSP